MNYSTFVLKVQPYSQTCDFFVKYNVTVFSKTSNYEKHAPRVSQVIATVAKVSCKHGLWLVVRVNKSMLSTLFYQPDNTLFVLPESLIMLLLLLQQFLSPVHQMEPAHILQMYIRKILFHLSWSEVLCNSQTVLSLEYLLQ